MASYGGALLDERTMAQITDPAGRVAEGMPNNPAKPEASLADKNSSAPPSPERLRELLDLNAELLTSRQFYYSVVRDIPHPIVVTDLNDLIILFNTAAIDLFGWREEEVAGCPLDRILARENPPEVLAGLKRDRDLNREWSGELLGRTISGTHPLLRVDVSPVTDEDGNTVAFTYLAMDVTEERRLRNLTLEMDRMTRHNEMAARIAHTMNNFLAVLSGSAQLIPIMLKSGKTDKVIHRLDIMQSTLVKIQEYCEGLKIADLKEADRSSQDINSLVEYLVGYLKPQDLYSSLCIETTLAEALPVVHIGVIQIQQVIAILIENAAQAVAQKSIQDGLISVATGLAADGRSIKVSVSDNGEGISDERIGTLSHQRYSSRQGRRGLGLVTARQILADHGGQLELESELGKGSTITLHLPVAESLQGSGIQEVRGDSSCTA